MNRWLTLVSVTGLVVLSATARARALVAAPPPPGPARVAQAAAIIVGRVAALEDKDIAVQGATYRIAVVQVTETIKGPKDQMVKVGFLPRQQPNPGQPIIRQGRLGNVQLQVGQEGLFFLSKGPEEKFFTAPMYYDFIPSQQGDFQRQVGMARLGVKIGDQPLPALKSDKADERLYGAAVLIQKYRQFPGMPNAKTEPIAADESKLILHALAKADWSGQPGVLHPWNLFLQLGLKKEDGWELPRNVRDQKEVHQAAQGWLAKNAESYRIQRFVGTPGARPAPGNPQIQPLPGKNQIKPNQIKPL